MYPAVEPQDVESLTRSIDFVMGVLSETQAAN